MKPKINENNGWREWGCRGKQKQLHVSESLHVAMEIAQRKNCTMNKALIYGGRIFIEADLK
jgi:hypothetical protein